jgi:hypothetical protein
MSSSQASNNGRGRDESDMKDNPRNALAGTVKEVTRVL